MIKLAPIIIDYLPEVALVAQHTNRFLFSQRIIVDSV